MFFLNMFYGIFVFFNNILATIGNTIGTVGAFAWLANWIARLIKK